MFRVYLTIRHVRVMMLHSLTGYEIKYRVITTALGPKVVLSRTITKEV